MQLAPIYLRIYLVVRQIPPGRVATYGQIGAIVGVSTPRMVGYALASLPAGSDVPWHRVVNAQGKISLRANSGENSLHRQLLEEEGVYFNAQNRLDFRRYRWSGPELGWLVENGFDPAPTWRGE